MKTKIYVVVSIWSGVLNEIEAFEKEQDAKRLQEEWAEDLNVEMNEEGDYINDKVDIRLFECNLR